MKKKLVSWLTFALLVLPIFVGNADAQTTTPTVATSCMLTATPSTAHQNEIVTLSWTAPGAILGVIDQGIGIVPLPSSSASVYPWGSSTMYTMTVATTTGVSTCSTTVTVLPPPPVPAAKNLLGCWSVLFKNVATADANKDKGSLIKAPSNQVVCLTAGYLNSDGSQSYSGEVPGNYTAYVWAGYAPTLSHVTIGITLNDDSTRTQYQMESHVYFTDNKEIRADGLMNGLHRAWSANAPDMEMNGDAVFVRTNAK